MACIVTRCTEAVASHSLASQWTFWSKKIREGKKKMPFPKQNKKITNQSTSKKVTKTNPKTSKQVLRFFFSNATIKQICLSWRWARPLNPQHLRNADDPKPTAFLCHVSLLFRHIQRKKKYIYINLFSWFWLEPGPQPGCPENIPYLSLEMQQTRAGPVYGVDATGVPRTHSPEPCPASRHQTADTRWERGKALGSIVVVELLERS